MTGTTRVAALTATLALTLVHPAAAQLTTGEVGHDLLMQVAVAQNEPPGGDFDSFKLTNLLIPFSGSGADTLPLTVLTKSRGGTATVSGFVSWSVSPTSIIATAEFSATSTASGQDSAGAGFNQSFGIRYQVSAPTAYRLTGSLRTQGALDPNEFLTCNSNGVPLAGGDPTTLPPNTAVLFERDGAVYPGETASISCRVIGGSALTESANQRWEFQVQLTPLSTDPTTTTTIPKKACRQACKQAKAECRAACPETGTERRACRRDCKKRAKRCGQSTGCALPVE
jgi:hypothetical protein